MKIRFDKYQGCGNDFIIIDNLNNQVHLSQKQISDLCDRHYGIGADGLILLENRDGFYMNYFNADGSLAEMCGNGLRCTADYIYRNYPTVSESFEIKCLDGIHRVHKKDEEIQVTVSSPVFLSDGKEIFSNKDQLKKISNYGFLNVGNPHLVLLTENIEEVDLDQCKFLSENGLEDGINVNLVELIDPNHLKVLTYERGDGFTLACGTGACASVSFINKIGLCADEVQVEVPGGNLGIKINKENITLTGAAQRVFQGEVILIE